MRPGRSGEAAADPPARRRLRWAGLALLAGLSPAWAAEPAGAAADAPVPVRFAPEKDYGPFVFVDGDGVVRGLSVDLLALLQQRAGLQVRMLPAAPLAEQLAAMREGRADLLSSLRPTPERAEYLAFSIPYVSVPAILVHRADAPASPADAGSAVREGLAALAGRVVAVGEAYAVEGFVRSRFPQVSWVTVPDDAAALRGVAEGRYAAAVLDSASASFIQRRQRLKGLQSAGPVGFEYVLSFAVPRHREDLRARIDDGIRAIGAAERLAIVERWMKPLGDAQTMPSRWQSLALRWGLGLIALAGAAALWLALRRRRPDGGGAG